MKKQWKRFGAYVLALLMTVTSLFTNVPVTTYAGQIVPEIQSMFDDFEGYGNQSVSNTWKKNDGGDTVNLSIVADKGEGHALSFQYDIGSYAGVVKSVNVNASKAEGISLWKKLDGSSNKLTVQLKDSNGYYWEAYIDNMSADSDEGVVRFPFSEFKAPSWSSYNQGKAGDATIKEIALYVNGSGKGTLYFDNIGTYSMVEQKEPDYQEKDGKITFSSDNNWSATDSTTKVTQSASGVTATVNNKKAQLRRTISKDVNLSGKKYIGYRLTYSKDLDGKLNASIAGKKTNGDVTPSQSQPSQSKPSQSQPSQVAPSESQPSRVQPTPSQKGLYVDGTKLCTADGQQVAMRGTNVAHVFFPDRTITDLNKNAELGANAVRLVLGNGYPAANGWTAAKNDAAQVEKLIQECKKLGMIAVLDDQTTTGGDDTVYLDRAVNYWIEMKDMLNKYKDCAIVNIANEWSGSWVSSNSNYKSAYINAVKKLREAGIENVLMVDAAGWGQDIMGLADVAPDILAADPNKNTMFSGHMYCYGAPDESGVKQRIDTFINKNLCFCVGEFGWKHQKDGQSGSIPYKTIMSYAQEKNVGWLAWSWYGNGSEGNYLQQGELDLVNADNSLKSPWGTDVAEQLKGAKKVSFSTASVSANTTAKTMSAAKTADAETEEVTKAGNGMYINGNKLMDGNGNEFVMRGVNIGHQWFTQYTKQAIEDSASLGSNTVRIVLGEGSVYTKASASEVSDIVNWAKASGQVCILELHDFTGGNDASQITQNCVNYWKGIKDVLNANKDYVILNIANEWRGKWSSSVSDSEKSLWKDTYKTAVKALRDAGIENVIMIDAAGYGNEATTVCEGAKEVLAADTTGNTMFSYHVYSSFGGDLTPNGGGTGAAITKAMDALKATGVCMCVGEFGFWQNGSEVDERTLVDYCATNNIGWVAWSWSGNGGIDEPLDLTSYKTHSKNDLSDWGKWVFGTKNGIQETSKLAYSGKTFSGTKITGTPDSLESPKLPDTSGGGGGNIGDIDAGELASLDWGEGINYDGSKSWSTAKFDKLENGGFSISNIDLAKENYPTFVAKMGGADLTKHKSIDILVRNNNSHTLQLCLGVKGGEVTYDDGSTGPALAETKSVDQTKLQNGRAPYIDVPKNKTVHVKFDIDSEHAQVYNGSNWQDVYSNVDSLNLRVQAGNPPSSVLENSLEIISIGYDWPDGKFDNEIAELNRPKTATKWVWNDRDFNWGTPITYSQDNEAGTVTMNYSVYNNGPKNEKGTGIQAQTNPGGDSKVGEDWTPYKSVSATLENTSNKPVHVTFLCRNGGNWTWAENSGYDDENGRTSSEECIIGANDKINVRYLLNEATWRTEGSGFNPTDSLADLDIVKCVAFKVYAGENDGEVSGTLKISNFQVNFGEKPSDSQITPSKPSTSTPSTSKPSTSTPSASTPSTVAPSTPASTEKVVFESQAKFANKVYNEADDTYTAIVYAPIDSTDSINAVDLTLTGGNGQVKISELAIADSLKALGVSEEPNPDPEVIEVENVTLDKSSIELTEGETSTLSAKVAPENATDKTLTWSSDHPEIADVTKNGKVTAVAEGKAVITVASTNGKKAVCNVTVKKKTNPDPDPVETTIKALRYEKNITLDLKEVMTLQIKTKPGNAKATYTFKSSDEKVVALKNAKGKIVGKAPGIATVTVTVKEAPALKATIKVRVRTKKVADLRKTASTTNSLTLAWQRQKNVTGYQVYMYDEDEDEFVSYKKINGYTNNKLTVNGLEDATYYRFKVRSYKQTDNGTVYGPFSKELKTKTKRAQ